MPNELFDLNGRVALVTGGNRGIGRAIALAFAHAGASVAILGRDGDKNQNVLAELQAAGRPCVALQVNIAHRGELEPAVRQVESELGPLSVLVNNAGIANPGGLLLDEGPDDWDNVMETNLTAQYLLSKQVARSMVRRRAGKIINIASLAAAFGNAIVPAYTVSKAALVNLTKCMAVELAPYNIQVNAIAPGYIETDMTRPLKTTPLYELFMNRTLAKRPGQPEEIAGAAIFLASRASDFVTGQTIFVDGGFSVSYLS